MSNKHVRICLWSGPRNISTALMYSFAQRSDTRIFDEPLYGHYLVNTHARYTHPDAEEVIASMEVDGKTVIQELVLGEHDKPVLFFKHMAHHLVELDWAFMDETINIILTRDPVEVLPSYIKLVNEPTAHDVSYPQQIELLDYLRARGKTPLVLDSRQTLLDPRCVLTKLCQHIGIPFSESMLSWTAGARPEDGVWGKHWYHTVHRTTGFQPYKPKTAPFPDRLRPLLAECQGYYEKLSPLTITAE